MGDLHCLSSRYCVQPKVILLIDYLELRYDRDTFQRVNSASQRFDNLSIENRRGSPDQVDTPRDHGIRFNG